MLCFLGLGPSGPHSLALQEERTPTKDQLVFLIDAQPRMLEPCGLDDPVRGRQGSVLAVGVVVVGFAPGSLCIRM